MKNKWAALYGILFLGLMLGGIYSAKAANIWQVSGKINPDGSKVELKGADVEEIKGWVTLGDAIEAFGLEKETVYRDLGIDPSISSDAQLSELAEETDELVSPSVLKDYISSQKDDVEDSTIQKEESNPVEEKNGVSEELEEQLTTINGKNTLKEVIEQFELNQQSLYDYFKLSDSLSVDIQLKQLSQETDEAVSPQTIKDYIRMEHE